MRRLLATLIGLLAAGAAPVSAVAQDILSVPLDRSVKIMLPPGSKRVMLGNSGVVDITILDMRTAVLLGRTFGATNLLVLDAQGRTLMDQEINVADSGPGRITLYTGPSTIGEGGLQVAVRNFTCSPRCVRYPMPGEASADQSAYVGPYDQYAAKSAGSGPSPAASPTASASPAASISALPPLAGGTQSLGLAGGGVKVGP